MALKIRESSPAAGIIQTCKLVRKYVWAVFSSVNVFVGPEVNQT